MSNIYYPRQVEVSGNITGNGTNSSPVVLNNNIYLSSVTASSGVSGSLIGTASYSTNAGSLGGVLPSNYALSSNVSSSFAKLSGATFTGGVTGSFSGSLLGTASYATSASYATNANSLDGYDNTSFAKLASTNIFTQNQILSGNIIFKSGNGIDFSATTNGNGTLTSETFDDYEEGTWTPNFDSGTGVITNSSSCNGTYTKIGRLVYAYGYIEVQSIGIGSNAPYGYLRITGIPYTPLSSTTTSEYSGLISYYINLYGLITGSSYETYQVVNSNNNNYLVIKKPYDTEIIADSIVGSTKIKFSIIYPTNT